MAKPERAEIDDTTLEAQTLLGDVRTALLDALRNMPKPYAAMSQGEQQDLIDGCTKVATHVITETTRIVAGHKFPSVFGKLVKAQVKDGMQLQIDVSRFDPHRLTLLDSVSRQVLVVIPEPDMFMGEREPAKPDAKPDLDGENVAPFKGRD